MSKDKLGTVAESGANDVLDLCGRVDKAIEEFVVAIETLERDPSEEAAEEVCSTCRQAVQLFFFARGDFGEDATPRTPELIDSLERAKTACERTAAAVGPDSIVWRYIENIKMRQELVQARVAGDVARVRALIRRELSAGPAC